MNVEYIEFQDYFKNYMSTRLRNIYGVVCSSRGSSIVDIGVPHWLPLSSLVSLLDSTDTPCGTLRGPVRARWTTVGCVLGGWHPSPPLLHRPGPLAIPSEVTKAVATQATSWQPASRYSVRVGQTIETPVTKLCGDPLGLRELL